MDINYRVSFSIDLPADASATLKRLADDCDLTLSQCITQLLRRHGADLYRLFATCIPIDSVPVVFESQQSTDGGAKALAFFDSVLAPAIEDPNETPKTQGAKLADWLNAPPTDDEMAQVTDWS